MTVHPEALNAAPCPNCGGSAGVARGRLSRDGEPYAVYLLDWCEQAEERRAVLSASVGDWSQEGSPSARAAFGVEMGPEGWRILDAPERDDLGDWGPFLPDAEVRKREAVDQVRAIARLVMFEDPAAAAVNEWTVGERETALPAAPGTAAASD
jgi:hypothetical protein